MKVVKFAVDVTASVAERMRRTELQRAVDRDLDGTGQAVRIVVDDSQEPARATAYVLIAEAPEDVRSRVVPTLIIQWAIADQNALGPEFDHVIDSFRFTPPTTSLVE